MRRRAASTPWLLALVAAALRCAGGEETCVVDFVIARWEPRLLHPGRSAQLTLRGLGLDASGASAHLRFSYAAGEAYSAGLVTPTSVSATELVLPIPTTLPINVSLLEVTLTRPADSVLATALVRLAPLPTVGGVAPATLGGIGGESVRLIGTYFHAAAGATTLVELSYDGGERVVEVVVGGGADDQLACELAFTAPALLYPHTSEMIAGSTDRATNVSVRVSTNGGYDYSEPWDGLRLVVRPKLLVGYISLEAPDDLGWTANWCAQGRGKVKG